MTETPKSPETPEPPSQARPIPEPTQQHETQPLPPVPAVPPAPATPDAAVGSSDATPPYDPWIPQESATEFAAPYEPAPGGGFGSGGPDVLGGPGRSERPRRRRGVTALVAVALVAGLVGGGIGAGVTHALGNDKTSTVISSLAGTPSVNTASNLTNGSVEQVAAQVLPSVVSITVNVQNGVGEGSGVILSSDGLILTNNHVVAEVSSGGQMTVTFNNGKTVDATVVGTDPTSDLAVIRATGVSGLTPATLGSSSSLVVGQPVVAIGSPLGLQGTVTSGIVSALNRPVSTSESNSSSSSQNTVLNAIQTDAAINPGNSGGPLVNLAGQVVGINSAIASLGSSSPFGGGSSQSGSIGVGFSIPIDQARPIADQLIATGHAKHPVLGVSVQDATSSGLNGGAKIVSVTSGGPAATAGLKAGDIVTMVNDQEIANSDALVATIRAQHAGEKITVTYTRNGATATATVTLSESSS